MAVKTPEQQAADLQKKFEEIEAQKKAEEALAKLCSFSDIWTKC